MINILHIVFFSEVYLNKVMFHFYKKNYVIITILQNLCL